VSLCADGSSHLAGVPPTIAGWPTRDAGFHAGGMTQRAHERELDTVRRPSADATGRGDARSELWEFLGMALAASCLCLTVIRPGLCDDVVHTLATRAVELGR
jgi:hypothetical protein